MAKLFIICGHGAGDPGACSGGYSEADLVRKLASRIKTLGGSDVQVGDTSVNWYASNYIGKGKCPKGVPVLELHMDSASASAKGGHVIIKAGFNADSYDNALAKFIGGMFPGRSKTIVGRSDLANPNRAANMGVNYRLLECCFISNDGDRTKFINNMDELARGILSAFGIKAGSGSSSSGGSSSGSGSGGSSTSTSYTVKITTDVLNVRKGPGTNYGVATTVKRGEVYTIIGEVAGSGASKWLKLKSGAGYISSDFCERTGTASSAFKPYVARVTTDVLNVRKGAGTNYAKVGTVKKGEAYTIVAESDGQGAKKWGKLKSGIGYVSLDFMKKV